MVEGGVMVLGSPYGLGAKVSCPAVARERDYALFILKLFLAAKAENFFQASPCPAGTHPLPCSGLFWVKNV
jgi:hypothetical protein